VCVCVYVILVLSFTKTTDCFSAVVHRQSFRLALLCMQQEQHQGMRVQEQLKGMRGSGSSKKACAGAGATKACPGAGATTRHARKRDQQKGVSGSGSNNEACTGAGAGAATRHAREAGANLFFPKVILCVLGLVLGFRSLRLRPCQLIFNCHRHINAILPGRASLGIRCRGSWSPTQTPAPWGPDPGLAGSGPHLCLSPKHLSREVPTPPPRQILPSKWYSLCTGYVSVPCNQLKGTFTNKISSKIPPKYLPAKHLLGYLP
jgi:hypothetical protein